MIADNDYKGTDLLLNNIKKDVYPREVKQSILNTQNNQLNTPAHLAIINGQQSIVRKLDKLGANLSLPNKDDLVIKMTETDANTSQTSINKDVSATSDFNDSSSNMRDILNNLLKPFVQSNGRTNQLQPQRINVNAPLNLTTITSSDDRLEQVNRNRNRNTINIPVTKDVDLTESDRINTDDFINFLRKRSGNQLGGNNTEVQSIKGKRKMKGKKIESNDNTANSATNVTDSLGIAAVLAQQTGGRKKKSKSSKRLTARLSSRSKSYRSRSSKSSRSRSASRKNRPSSDVHSEVIDVIKKLGYSEDDARYIKAGLYQQIKDKFPNLSNMQRAIKMKELANADEVKKIAVHLPKLKELVMKAREQRMNEKESSNKEKKDKKETKEAKPAKEVKAKKTSKASRSKASRSKKSKSKKSKRTSRY